MSWYRTVLFVVASFAGGFAGSVFVGRTAHAQPQPGADPAVAVTPAAAVGEPAVIQVPTGGLVFRGPSGRVILKLEESSDKYSSHGMVTLEGWGADATGPKLTGRMVLEPHPPTSGVALDSRL